MARWYKTCPRCNQGRLFIMQLNESKDLCLHCEECEWNWLDPKRVTEIDAGSLGIDYDIDSASLAVIEAEGWNEYALHED
jgi:transcription elongation factor Elf1